MIPFLNLNELSEYILKNKDRRVTLTFHSIGDRDGVAAAVALSQMFTHAEVVTPDFITNNAKHMVEHSGYTGRIGGGLSKFTELVVIVDANRLELLGKMGEHLVDFRGEILFIDHHSLAGYPDYGGKVRICNDELYNSASSIVYELLKMNKIPLKREIAYMLINGIVSDSANFQNSSPQTFRQISELLEGAGLDYPDVIDNTHGSASAEIRNRIMKDLFSAATEVCGNYVIVYGPAQFQANTAAETALSLGADASLFWSMHDGEVSFSGRLRAPLDKKLSIHLGKIMAMVGPMISGTGGGHPCAAGAYGKKSSAAEEAKQYILKAIREKFGSESR